MQSGVFKRPIKDWSKDWSNKCKKDWRKFTISWIKGKDSWRHVKNHLKMDAWNGVFIFLGCLNFFTAITAIIGNSLIINALRRNRSLHSPSKALLYCLALSDLGVGLIVQPIFVITTFANVKGISSILAALENPFISRAPTMTLVYVSLWTMTTVAVDRFLAFHVRQRYRAVVTLRRLLPLLVSYWIIAGTMGIYFAWRSTYIFISGSISVFLCIIISSFSFVKVYLSVRHQVRIQDQTQQNPNANVFNMGRYKKSVESMLCVYILFLISYLPESCVLADWFHRLGELLFVYF